MPCAHATRFPGCLATRALTCRTIRSQEVFPTAEIEAQVNSSSKVKIVCQEPQQQAVVEVSQRDLYAKYRWPAAPKMTEFLQAFKEEYES